MTKKYVPKALRKLVLERARNRCEYCLSQGDLTAIPMEIDHIFPEALEGLTREDNLCLACSYCNDSKHKRNNAPDPVSGEVVSLFNPRTQIWSEHFAWSEKGDEVLGLTPTGRATVVALRLNRFELFKARRAWVKAGWHPPQD